MDWFLYDRDLRRERIIQTDKTFLHLSTMMSAKMNAVRQQKSMLIKFARIKAGVLSELFGFACFDIL